jgi:hypothetical protein
LRFEAGEPLSAEVERGRRGGFEAAACFAAAFLAADCCSQNDCLAKLRMPSGVTSRREVMPESARSGVAEESAGGVEESAGGVEESAGGVVESAGGVEESGDNGARSAGLMSKGSSCSCRKAGTEEGGASEEGEGEGSEGVDSFKFESEGEVEVEGDEPEVEDRTSRHTFE